MPACTRQESRSRELQQTRKWNADERRKAQINADSTGVNLFVCVLLFFPQEWNQGAGDLLEAVGERLVERLNHAVYRAVAHRRPEAKALGACIFGLTDKASTAGQKLSKRRLAKQASVFRTDFAPLDEFRVRVDDRESE